MTKPITKKQYDIFYKSLDDEPGKDKKVKRIARESDTSLSHTYRCLKELKKHGNVLQTWKRPKQFIRVGRLPEPKRLRCNKTKKKQRVAWLKYSSGYYKVWVDKKEQGVIGKAELNKILKKFGEPLV